MSDLTIALTVGAIFGLIFGPLTARSSAHREKIYGGTPAKAIHMIACGMMVSVPPAALTGLIVGLHWQTLIPMGLTLLFGSLGVLMAFAALEKPAIPAKDAQLEKGWTAEDARASGM
jgi:hypothetical protein